jgi:hypothetical protein
MRIPLAGWLALGFLTGCVPDIDTESLKKDAKAKADAKDDQYDGKGIFGKTTRELVDKKAAMAANPNLIIKNSNVAGGRDPLRQSDSTYTFAAAFFGSLPLQQYVQHHKALEGRTPTYAEMDAWMKQNPGVKLPLIEQWKMYGYDEEAGTIVILEDTKVKERIYKEKGIPLE